MNRLFGVELRRLYVRRLTRIVALLALGICLLALYATWDQSRPPSQAERAQAQAAYEQAALDWEQNGPQLLADCKASEAEQRKTDATADFGCDQMQPRRENFGSSPPLWAELWPGTLDGAALPGAFLAFVIGAGFVAAEFGTGSIGTWLTFEPRRGRVFASKLAAAGVGLLPLGLLMVVLVVAGSYLIVRADGQVGLPAGQGLDPWWASARAVLVVGLAGAAGAAAGFLLRHTAAVLGVLGGYLIVVELILGNSLPIIVPWLVAINVTAVIHGKAPYYVNDCRLVDGIQNCSSVERTISLAHGSAYVAVALILLVALAGALFRRRDVS